MKKKTEMEKIIKEIQEEIKELVEAMRRSLLWRLPGISSFFENPFQFKYDDIEVVIESFMEVTVTINTPKGGCIFRYDRKFPTSWIQTIHTSGTYEELKKIIKRLKKGIEQEKLIFSSHFDSPIPIKEGIETLQSAREKMEKLNRSLLPDLRQLIPLALNVLMVKDHLRLDTNIDDLIIDIERSIGEPYPIKIRIPSIEITFISYLGCCDKKSSFNDPSTWYITFPMLSSPGFKSLKDLKYTYKKIALFRKHLKKRTFKILLSKTLVPLREVETLMAI